MAIYHIVSHTYGTWLTGDERGSIKAPENNLGQPILEHQPRLVTHIKSRMRQKPIQLNGPMRLTVEETIREVCGHRQWKLYAQNVRQNHVHIVVGASCEANKVWKDLKSYSTRALRRAELIEDGATIWAEGGSGRQIKNVSALEAVIDYVLNGQGPDLHELP